MKGIKALTPRDLQVIRMIAQGTERDAVADELGVSRSSINRQLRHAFDSTDTRNAAHLIATLARAGVEGFVPPAYTKLVDTSTDTRDRVVRKIRAEMVKSPLGSAEEHTNYVIEQLAAMVHRELS